MAVLAAASFLPVVVYICLLAYGKNLYMGSIQSDGSLSGRPDLEVGSLALYLAIGLMLFVLLLTVGVFLFYCFKRRSRYMRYVCYRVFSVTLLIVLINCCYIPSYANFFGFSLLHPSSVICSYLFAFVGGTALAAAVDAAVLLGNNRQKKKSGKMISDIVFAAVSLLLIALFIMYCTQAHALEWIALLMPMVLCLLVPLTAVFLALRVVFE